MLLQNFSLGAMQPCSALGPNPLVFRAKLMIQSSLLEKVVKTGHSAFSECFPLSPSTEVV